MGVDIDDGVLLFPICAFSILVTDRAGCAQLQSPRDWGNQLTKRVVRGYVREARTHTSRTRLVSVTLLLS